MQPGIVHFMIYPQVIKGEGPVLETLERIVSDDYFKVVEITWIKDATTRAKAKAMLEASGMTIKYGAQPRLLTQQLNLNSPDLAQRNLAVATIIEGIDEAIELGLTDLGLLSGAYPGEDQKEAQMDLLEDSLDQICSYASGKGVNISLEVFDQKIDKKCLIGPAADALEICNRLTVKYPSFGLIVDLSHIPLLGESPAEALRPVAKFVRHIHIGNAYMDSQDDPAYGDHHPRFGYPGGMNDVDEIVDFLEELFNIGYLKADGRQPMPVSFEIKPVGDEDPAGMIANSKRKLNEAWVKLKDR
ncbi:MAG: sugar phosphate isomerase/epimerase [Cyclobacteriaceae bacterium]